MYDGAERCRPASSPLHDAHASRSGLRRDRWSRALPLRPERDTTWPLERLLEWSAAGPRLIVIEPPKAKSSWRRMLAAPLLRSIRAASAAAKVMPLPPYPCARRAARVGCRRRP